MTNRTPVGPPLQAQAPYGRQSLPLKEAVSALYHTFIATCQMMGLSVLKYFKSLFSEIAKGRTDYENMLPMTIGLCKVA